MFYKKKLLVCKVCEFKGEFEVFRISIKEKKIPKGLVRKSLETTTSYFCCTNCSSINYLEREENSQLDYQDENYMENSNEYFYSSDFTEFLFKTFKNKPMKILEIGPGSNGLFSHLKRKLNIKEISALESNKKLWKFTQNYNFQYSNLNQIDDRYDAIIGIGVLEHIEKPFKFLKELKMKNLEKNGLLVFQYPNIGALNRFLMNNAWDMHHEPGHITIPSIKSFEINNFQIIKTITSTKLSRGRIPFYAKRGANIELKYKRLLEKNKLFKYFDKKIFKFLDKLNLGETITVISK